MADLILKPGREKSLRRQHPWVFSGAVAELRGTAAPGDTVRVCDARGQPLAQAAYSPSSQIRARAWTFDAGARVDAGFLAARIEAAVRRRGRIDPGGAARLVHGESDGLPGLIADRYADLLVVQYLSAGAERWREEIADALLRATGLARLYERSDADVRALEGLAPRSGPLRGAAPDAPLTIVVYGLRLVVEVAHGNNTGFYVDPRDNRRLAREAAAGGGADTALNVFCYTGAFSLALAAGGARAVLSIDSSGAALDLARANAAASGLDPAVFEWREADAFAALRELRDQSRRFDLVVLDPPKFAPTPASVERAARAYKDINLLGMKLLRPGGRLFTFSCSGGVSAELFQKIVAGAAQDAGCDAVIARRLWAAPDHPVRLAFPEGEYLKGLLLERL
ncbi:MAG: class I SAM-dependent methyltransferase [Burkholderiales bacterium]|nr:class I SAM-dependent methyltransferase [Burkholderiales bacterium]